MKRLLVLAVVISSLVGMVVTAQFPTELTATITNAAGDEIGTVSFATITEDMTEGMNFPAEAIIGATAIWVEVQGLTPGFHGFHIHSVGTCDPSGERPFASAGGHLHGEGEVHGQHMGDLPSLLANESGAVLLVTITDRFTLADLMDEDGSAVIIHAAADNFGNIPVDRYDPDADEMTLNTGDAGGRVGCGVITASSLEVQTSEAAIDQAVTRASAGVNSNAAWQAFYPEGFIQAVDGVDMVLVPAGCFQMGNDPKGYNFDGDSWELGVPDGGQVCFDEPFWIDRTEVTQADFVRLNGSKANPNAFSGDNRPVENITWAEARDFCQLRGGRLPTEAEWEYAARGVDGLFFPWGNGFVSENAVWNRDPAQGTADVASIPVGASWVGAVDMSGNVWEWVNSLYVPYPYDVSDGREADIGQSVESPRGLRGSSWFGDVDYLLRATLRGWSDPTIVTDIWGFRCARSTD